MSDLPLKYVIHNKNPTSMVVIIEPWAEELNVPSNSTLEISVIYSKIGPIETTINERYTVVWLWSGCRATVSLDGQDCTPRSLDIPAPG
jgi:hypothetical protein